MTIEDAFHSVVDILLQIVVVVVAVMYPIVYCKMNSVVVVDDSFVNLMAHEAVNMWAVRVVHVAMPDSSTMQLNHHIHTFEIHDLVVVVAKLGHSLVHRRRRCLAVVVVVVAVPTVVVPDNNHRSGDDGLHYCHSLRFDTF